MSVILISAAVGLKLHFVTDSTELTSASTDLRLAPYIYSHHLGVTPARLPMKLKPCSKPKSCFTPLSDAACVDLFSHKQSKHNTC